MRPNFRPPRTRVLRLLSRWRAGCASVVLQQNRRSVADRAMGTFFVIVPTPSLYLFLGVGKAQEPVGVEAFLPEASGRREGRISPSRPDLPPGVDHESKPTTSRSSASPRLPARSPRGLTEKEQAAVRDDENVWGSTPSRRECRAAPAHYDGQTQATTFPPEPVLKILIPSERRPRFQRAATNAASR